jgi:hypothetical protein
MLLAFSSVFLQPSLGCRARFHTGARTWMHGRWTPQRPKKRSRPTNFVFAQVHWRPNTTHRHTDDQRQSLSCAKHACATARTRFAANAHRTFTGEADIRDDGSQEGGDRNAENAKRVYALKLQRFAGPSPSQCSRCWHEIKSCICPTAPSPVAGLFPHRIIIYMHLKEFARGSNTGSLCQVAFPSSTTVHVASVPEVRMYVKAPAHYMCVTHMNVTVLLMLQVLLRPAPRSSARTKLPSPETRTLHPETPQPW